MVSKNLKYYRLKKSISKKKLAALCGVTPMAISNYESGKRSPSIKILQLLACALDARVSDFLAARNKDLVCTFGEFRKTSALSVSQQEYIKESVEEYFSRFFTVVEFLGGEVLPKAPVCHKLSLSKNDEKDAQALRNYLGLAEDGPIGNLIEVIETKGILVYPCKIDNDSFFGMNGFVNEHPYIIVNNSMTAERNRSTIVHELAHLMFDWTEAIPEKEAEKLATAISGAFLFPAADAKRELGIQRKAIAKDMLLVCQKYGISMYLLVKRAQLCGIVTESLAKEFFINANKKGWRKNEPSRIKDENPMLFEQLVYRAVSENDISIQKGAELLRQPYSEVEQYCCFDRT